MCGRRQFRHTETHALRAFESGAGAPHSKTRSALECADDLKRLMELTNMAKDKITVAFSPGEVAFLSNAINEALEAVDEWEFQTRTGETPKRAVEICAQLGEFLDEAKRI